MDDISIKVAECQYLTKAGMLSLCLTSLLHDLMQSTGTESETRCSCPFSTFRASLYALAGCCRSLSWRRGGGRAQRLLGGGVRPGWGGGGSLEASGPAHPAQAGPERHQRGLHRNPQGEACKRGHDSTFSWLGFLFTWVTLVTDFTSYLLVSF